MTEPIEKLKQLQLDYQHAFGDEAGKRVLADLSQHCYDKKPTFDKDDRVHAMREGMRAVLLHILTMLSLNVNELEKQLKEREDYHG
jgi:hypothetical protein